MTIAVIIGQKSTPSEASSTSRREYAYSIEKTMTFYDIVPSLREADQPMNQTTHAHTEHVPVIFKNGLDGKIIAECPGIPGVISQGDTEEEALRNLREVYQMTKEVKEEMGLPFYSYDNFRGFGAIDVGE
jgi:predicted RNase H-like HicB family nuclease